MGHITFQLVFIQQSNIYLDKMKAALLQSSEYAVFSLIKDVCVLVGVGIGYAL